MAVEELVNHNHTPGRGHPNLGGHDAHVGKEVAIGMRGGRKFDKALAESQHYQLHQKEIAALPKRARREVHRHILGIANAHERAQGYPGHAFAADIEEFFNKTHSKESGRFATAASDKAVAKYETADKSKEETEKKEKAAKKPDTSNWHRDRIIADALAKLRSGPKSSSGGTSSSKPSTGEKYRAQSKASTSSSSKSATVAKPKFVRGSSEEFYNHNHSPSDGKFTSGGAGSTSRQAANAVGGGAGKVVHQGIRAIAKKIRAEHHVLKNAKFTQRQLRVNDALRYFTAEFVNHNHTPGRGHPNSGAGSGRGREVGMHEAMGQLLYGKKDSRTLVRKNLQRRKSDDLERKMTIHEWTARKAFGENLALKSAFEEFVNRNHTPTSAHPNASGWQKKVAGRYTFGSAAEVEHVHSRAFGKHWVIRVDGKRVDIPGGISTLKQAQGAVEGFLHGRSGTPDASRMSAPNAPLYAQTDYHRGFGQGSASHAVTRTVEITKTPGGGGTVHPGTGREPTMGYAVAQHGSDVAIHVSEAFDPEGRSTTKFEQMIRTKIGQLPSNETDYLGSWHDPETGRIEVNHTKVIKTRTEAILEGQKGNQKEIWDIANSVGIHTGGTGEGGVNLAVDAFTEEFYNHNHSPTDGKFTNASGGNVTRIKGSVTKHDPDFYSGGSGSGKSHPKGPTIGKGKLDKFGVWHEEFRAGRSPYLGNKKSIGGRSPSLKWPHLYDILRAKGHDKESAAAISNSRVWARKGGALEGLPWAKADNPKALKGVLKKTAAKHGKKA